MTNPQTNDGDMMSALASTFFTVHRPQHLSVADQGLTIFASQSNKGRVPEQPPTQDYHVI